MKVMDYLNIFFTIAGLASIAGALLAWCQTRKLARAIRTSFLLDIRRLIDRIERNKAAFQGLETAYKELFDVQHELETINAKFLELFPIKNREKRS